MSFTSCKDCRVENIDATKCKKMFLFSEGHPVQVWVYQGKVVKRIPAPEFRNKDTEKLSRQSSRTSLDKDDVL